MSDFKVKMHQNPISPGAVPQTPLRELTAHPRPDGFKGPASKERRGDGTGEEGKREKDMRGDYKYIRKKMGREERGMLWSPKLP